MYDSMFTHLYAFAMCAYFHSGTTKIQNYYTGNGSNVFYLNNFDSISQSYGKLWFVFIMNHNSGS